MNFSDALILIKASKRLMRPGWHGKNMYVFLVPGSEFKVNREPLLAALGAGTEVNYRPHIDLMCPKNTLGHWIPSMCDLLADDWELCEEDVLI